MRPHIPLPLVLCEGKEDKLVMESLADHFGLAERIRFESYDGKDLLRPYLATLKSRPEFSRGEISKILVTRDADSDFSRAWDALIGAISAVFHCVPAQPGQWLSIENGPQITGWIIPGPNRAGMIETLCMDSANTKSPEIFTCLDSFVSCLEKVHGSPPHEKARFALWTIAAQGSGAQNRLSLKLALPKLPINWDDEAFSPLKDLLLAMV